MDIPANVIFQPSLNIFESPDQAIVNPVNVDKRLARQRRAGGLAGAFARAYSDNMKAYCAATLDDTFTEGTIFPYRISSGQWVINLPSKGRNVSMPSSLELIVPALDDLVEFILREKVASISMPRIGAGLGGLDFDLVLPHLMNAAQKTPLTGWRILSSRPKE